MSYIFDFKYGLVYKILENEAIAYAYPVPNSNPLGIKDLFQEFPYHLNVSAKL